jgi:plastocyanin
MLLTGIGAVALIAVIWACSSNNSPTNPNGGGGGGLELNSAGIPPGGVFQHTFASAGSFPYHCTIHAAMTGNNVMVNASSMNDSAFVQIVSTATPGFNPSSVTVKPGGHVRWLNANNVTHTVTSGN